MSKEKRSALVVCPGRGVYNSKELGYLGKHHFDKTELLTSFDDQRRALKQTPIRELDSTDRFSIARFTRGDNASGLIYACSYADFLSIDKDAFDIVAITGNSMGWYTALACSGSLSAEDGFKTVNTMGAVMHEKMIGAQLIYPIVDDEWRTDAGLRSHVLRLVDEIPDLFISIHLGGMIVLAGTQAAIDQAEASLEPVQGRYPIRPANHAAFHTPLLHPNSEAGRSALPAQMFNQPSKPIIDGQGKIWAPGACDMGSLWDYTFGDQITTTYDFTRAMQVGLKEFAPDCIIVLGPGDTLGGATAQSMISVDWTGMTQKADFLQKQSEAPVLLAMGRRLQRQMVVSD